MGGVKGHENMSQEQINAIVGIDDEAQGIQRVDVSAVATLARSETEAQLDAAHKHPRAVKRFLNEAMTLATLTKEVAESCIYALPRGGKVISGPSVRLAEIIASSYGNLHVASRVVDVEEKEVVAQGVAWDLEKNLRVSVEARRRITGKSGRRYDDDMITVTGAAAGSIALRNAIFRVVPRAYVDVIYSKVREVAVGDAKTLATRRQEVYARLQKIGVPAERILPVVHRSALEDVGLDDLEVLIGLGTAIKDKGMAIDDAFPPIDSAPGKAAVVMQALAPKAKASAKTKPEPVAATAPTEAPPPAVDEMDPEPEESKAAGRQPGDEG